MIRKLFLESYSFLKDIFLFTSNYHKVPTSFLFNKLPYQNLRILIDIFLTKKYQKEINEDYTRRKQKLFKRGEEDGIMLNLNFFSNNETEKLKLIFVTI